MTSAQVMILAAGRGERMRPLTDRTPKPLLIVHGRSLVEWHLIALAHAGFDKVVINTAWLGDQIQHQFGHLFEVPYATHDAAGSAPSRHVRISYSDEGRDFGQPIETAGGIVRALPLLADVFWVVAADIFAPGFAFPPEAIRNFSATDHLAHLWLVPNPDHNPGGDFALGPDGLLRSHGAPKFTFSTIGLYRKSLFALPYCAIPSGNALGVAAKLAPILRGGMNDQRISGETYAGTWLDIGTPERLHKINSLTLD